MKTCQRCGIAGTTVFTVPDKGDWHFGCWRTEKRERGKRPPRSDRVAGDGMARRRFKLNRVAHGYIVLDTETDEKICFTKHKSKAVFQLRQCRDQFKLGWIR